MCEASKDAKNDIKGDAERHEGRDWIGLCGRGGRRVDERRRGDILSGGWNMKKGVMGCYKRGVRQ